MKLNKILMALAATAMVGCSSEDLGDFSANQAPEDSQMIQLSDNFALAGVGEEGATTRTHWEKVGGALVNKFLPIYNASAAAGQALDVAAELGEQAVGLCWLGNGAVGTDVYTNYEFYHFGWLNKGAAKAEFDCGNLTNGSFYNEIKPLAAITNGAGGEADETLDFAGAIPGKSLAAGVDNLNYNSGIYKTENKAIFGGQYIVYYPYNQDFKNAGTIPAIAETTFNNVSEAFDTPEIGHATFRYSAPVTIEGGDQAADFGLYNLSSLVQLRVATPTSDATLAGVETIDQIVLYSPSQKLLKQANLAADKIAAGQKGTALYASTEGTKTITANFTAPVTLQKTNSTTPAPTSAYITVLPTTVDDLVVLVHSNSLSKWARINMGATEFEAGKAKRMDITVAAADFKSDFIAVDYPSLLTALTDANAAAASAPATINVIGDITLPADPNIVTGVYANCANITIKGDDIIVPEDVILNTATNWESDIRLLGKSCCTGTNGAILNIWGGSLSNVTMEPTEDKTPTPAKNPTVNYNGDATIVAGKTFDAQAGTINVNALAAPAVAVQHKGDIKIAEGVTLTVYADGDLNFMGGTVVNDGTIEVMKNGKYDMTDANGNATATDGLRMTNNGKFIHNVDAGVGTAVQKMNQNGEYRCKVDDQIKLDDAFLQWTACSVIEMVNGGIKAYDLGNVCQHNGKYIDFEINAGNNTRFINPTTAPDDKEIGIGNLTVVAVGTTGLFDIDFVEGTAPNIGKRTLTVNGDMTVKADTEFKDSKKITITENLNVVGATLTYDGNKQNEGGLAVTKDITVDGGGDFDASALNALDITCANFYLKGGATAEFGNRTEGDAKNLVVSGTISNPSGCTFDILPAAGANVLAWVTCKQLIVGGTFTGAKPRVE